MKRSVIILAAIAFASIAVLGISFSLDSQIAMADCVPSSPYTESSSTVLALPSDITRSNNNFAIDFYRTISDTDRNVFFSPTSMFVAFSMLYEGARENTADQMTEVFGFEPDTSARHALISSTLRSLNQEDKCATLAMDNALWISELFVPNDSYVSTVRNVYDSIVEYVSFTDNTGIEKINAWASEKTNEKIKEILTSDDVDALTALVLTNAIYFKGSWVESFPIEDTTSGDFQTTPSTTVDADLMKLTYTVNYLETDNAQIIELPYAGDRLSMLIALPKDVDGINQMTAELSAETVKRWQQDMTLDNVEITMPKFKIESTYDLKDPLKNLGVTDIFDSASDLSGLSPASDDRIILVSKAIQKAYVDVNEEGTEAAAVTAIVTTLESAPMLYHFKADHPFLFFIQDDSSGAILFMGRMSNPDQ